MKSVVRQFFLLFLFLFAAISMFFLLFVDVSMVFLLFYNFRDYRNTDLSDNSCPLQYSCKLARKADFQKSYQISLSKQSDRKIVFRHIAKLVSNKKRRTTTKTIEALFVETSKTGRNQLRLFPREKAAVLTSTGRSQDRRYK